MAMNGLYLCVLILTAAAILVSSSPVQDDPVAEPPPVITRTLKAGNNLTIIVQSNGNYHISQNGSAWLHNGATFFQSRGKMYTTSGGSLHQTHFGDVESGWDNLGEYSFISTTWQAQDCDFELKPDDEPIAEPPPCTKSTVITSIRAYKLSSLVVFSQDFKNVGFTGTSVNDKNKVCTGFPTFQIGTSQEKLGYISYGGTFLDSSKIGKWEKGTMDIESGINGGPLVLFDQNERTMVMSSFREFMAGSVYYNKESNTVDWGVMGSMTEIPRDFNYETAIVFGHGIKRTVEEFGNTLLKHYGKTRDYAESDFTSNYLGYWTDNGAYYYYHTAPNMNYDETLMQVKKYSDGLNIPYRYFQLDSWWYYKGVGGGVKKWTSRPDVFPKGLQDFYNRLGLPLVAHNRFWANDTDYAKKNGGEWNFIVEPNNKKAIPQDEGFWNYLLSTSREWGLIVYEQDWLSTEFEDMSATTQNPMVGSTWMNTLGAGASMNDLPIQFCMPMARHLLQSVQMPTVTQSRASGDYQPGNMQWNIGLSSIMLHALAIRPFKDNFWTMSTQPDSPYKGKMETNPQLQSVVATLSTGPVGPSDMLDHANATLIMRSCNTDGKLLQPSRPAMALSASIKTMAFGMSNVNGIIWSTTSDIPFGRSEMVFGHILAIEVTGPTELTPMSADLRMMVDIQMRSSMIYNDMDPINSVAPFDEKMPLRLNKFGSKDFQLWHTTPVMKIGNNTVLILGELSKWVKVSPGRITDISLTRDTLSLSMTGAPSEKVTMTFLFNMKPMPVTCTFPESRKVVLEVMDMMKSKCVNS
ncbi:uncharacterized protein [Amphiura filiformis]|uniref:uncharacterized protein isoform X1 n=1 Tax=Amphiura filiformis TaxID=82378 RepID=UPI003B217ABC